MSLLTCCPVCATMFKVVPDQLRISQGWVRCGKCAEVFDAMAHLQDRQPALPQPPPDLRGLQAAAGAPLEDREQQERADRQAAEAALTAEALAFAGRAPARDAAGDEDGYPTFTLLRPDDATPVREGDSRLGASVLDESDPKEPEAPRAPALPQDGAIAGTEHAELVTSPASDGPADLSADTPAPSFVQQARRRDLWRRPGVRLALASGAAALAAMLVVQYALHDRDWLASRSPALASLVGALCRAAGCAVGPPRQVDAIVIDSSTFTKLRADGYRLSLTLKNSAVNAVAMPAVELTLTDSQDQPVLRRVLMPAELGAQSDVLAANSEWTSTLGLTVLPGASPSRVSGYRVLAFYP